MPQRSAGLQPGRRHRPQRANWGKVTESNGHPEGAPVFKTGRITISSTFQIGGWLSNRNPVLSHAACFRNRLDTSSGTIQIPIYGSLSALTTHVWVQTGGQQNTRNSVPRHPFGFQPKPYPVGFTAQNGGEPRTRFPDCVQSHQFSKLRPRPWRVDSPNLVRMTGFEPVSNWV